MIFRCRWELFISFFDLFLEISTTFKVTIRNKCEFANANSRTVLDLQDLVQSMGFIAGLSLKGDMAKLILTL